MRFIKLNNDEVIHTSQISLEVKDPFIIEKLDKLYYEYNKSRTSIENYINSFFKKENEKYRND